MLRGRGQRKMFDFRIYKGNKKFEMFRNNKKGASIPSGLTWIPATILVFFIMFFFLAGVFLAFSDESSDFTFKDSSSNRYDLFLQNQLISFLNSEIEVEGEEYLVKDVIYNEVITEEDDSDDVSKEFKGVREAAKNFNKDFLRGVKKDFSSSKIYFRLVPFEFRLDVLSEEGETDFGIKEESSPSKGIFCYTLNLSKNKKGGLCLNRE